MQIGFLPLLFLIFLTLKLCGTIGWSWWWVTAPIWIPLAIFPAFFIMALGYAALRMAALCIPRGRRQKQTKTRNRIF